ncbi:sulfite oxidase heme-binding subunit YedZ [Stagnihabitans tardus]|uniref:Protein-methionine-sulfoxide reductase heme-binding subunit MsrQ n=1 Tax=Stagnihabitans tardus TaxID=2699202 RepID=A0AAE5BTX2_9RHOB|nr:protein-methionine-sulfoxide reductase heme-binding subunit MsrQ [Stagnihabitans tardus]NBZ86662.1 sulfoxide reductase heme-binding subunit YedZ [Stagnihabitans tardus]
MEALNQGLRRIPTWSLYVVGLAVAAWVVVPGLSAIDPVRDIERGLGLWAVRFLLLGLMITPLRWVGVNALRFRRQIGLVAFGLVVLHLLTWLVLDMGLRWDQIADDLVKRWYIMIGMASFVLLIPLAVTSNDRSIRWLRKTWVRLHKLAYPAAILAVVHFIMVQKVWGAEILIYAAILAGLLAARVWKFGPSRVVWG